MMMSHDVARVYRISTQSHFRSVHGFTGAFNLERLKKPFARHHSTGGESCNQPDVHHWVPLSYLQKLFSG